MANVNLSAKLRVCSLVGVLVMKTSVKFGVKKEEFVDPTMRLVLRSISSTVGLAKENKCRDPVCRYCD